MVSQTLRNALISTLSSRPVSALATNIIGTGTPIFMLHRTYPDATPHKKQTPSYLRACLDYLRKNGYHFISVTDILLSIKNNTALPKKSIAFTIDDGFIDQAALAAPVFLDFRCPVTIFLITGFLDGELWPWFSKVEYLIKNASINRLQLQLNGIDLVYPLTTDSEKKRACRQLLAYIKQQPWTQVDTILANISTVTNVPLPEQAPEDSRPMSWATARELEHAGISFGPHTRTHHILSRVSDEQSREEINHSWARLKAELKNPTPVFCYPNGEKEDFGEREIDFIKTTEMLGAISTIPMQYSSKFNEADVIYKLPRYSLPNDFNIFKMYSSWIEFAKDRLRKSRMVNNNKTAP